MAKIKNFAGATVAHVSRNKWRYVAGVATAAVAAGAYVMLRNTPVGTVAEAAADAMLEGAADAGAVVVTAAEAAAEAVA